MNWVCPKCGWDEDQPIRRGPDVQCRHCGKYTVLEKAGFEGREYEEFREGGSIKFEKNFTEAHVINVGTERKTYQQVMEEHGLDPAEWTVELFEVRDYKGYRKNRKVQWKVRDGKTVTGDVDDDGKMLVVTFYNHKLKVRKNVQVVNAKKLAKDIFQELTTLKPYKPKIYPAKGKSEYMLEYSLADFHLGKLSWGEEVGQDYDINIAEKRIYDTTDVFLSRITQWNIKPGLILLPLGQDYFNSIDGISTVSGTPQDEDTRPIKTFQKGVKICKHIIDLLSEIAPVKIVPVPGNHEGERLLHLAIVLSAIYEKSKRVTIDESPMARKYHRFHSCLICFDHGELKEQAYVNVIPYEQREIWNQIRHCEVHLGHTHHQTTWSSEYGPIIVRHLSALTATDAWHFKRGYIGAKQAAEAFLWHAKDGMVSHMTIDVPE